MSVPIATSPGRDGFSPDLALTYASSSGNGPFGFGWSLPLGEVTRKTAKGLPRYQDDDVFVLSGGDDLVPVVRTDDAGDIIRDADGRPVLHEDERDGFRVRRYRPRIEGGFALIERWTALGAADDVHWRTISPDNVLTIYGQDANARIFDPADPRRIFSWKICETRDLYGNAIRYRYKPEDAEGVPLHRASERGRGGPDAPGRRCNRYPKSIRYGNRRPLLSADGTRPERLDDSALEAADWMFELVFDYGEHDIDAPSAADSGPWTFRADPFSDHRPGFELRTTRLCRRVLMFHHFPDEGGVGSDCLVRSTDLTYSGDLNPESAERPIYTFLRQATQSGYQRDGTGYAQRTVPPVVFDYSTPEIGQTVETVAPDSVEHLPIGFDGSTWRWTDLFGEGLPGLLTQQAGAWHYKRNQSPLTGTDAPGTIRARFAPLETVAQMPKLGPGAQPQIMDLAGDGQPDLVLLDGPNPGLFEQNDDASWQAFRPFLSQVNRDLNDPNLRFVDLDGDGRADLLITDQDALIWHPALGEDGFGPARRVAHLGSEDSAPRLVFEDGTEAIYTADMSGDGLTDLVRLRSGSICYWPNLGHGRFGAKVTMDSAPVFDAADQFDQTRIRLADTDGSGTTDIIYLHPSGPRVYFNQSGNGWSAPQHVPAFPKVDDLSAVQAVDLLGNGTACLVWSSPLPADAARPMRYIALVGAQKPHLLIRSSNSLGAETRISYAPSTRFYLQDKRDGRPWITRLPFPVHVVERVETLDRVSRNRFVTRYAYHHGHYDGTEREFAGFGMVEQFDTEELAALAGTETLPGAVNIDAASHVPPVHTKTWYHTGLYLGGDRISTYFAGLNGAAGTGEYYRPPGLPDTEAALHLLPDTVLPPGLELEDARGACRALRGRMLRQEVYAQDDSAQAAHPYVVQEQNFAVQMIQPHTEAPSGIYFAHDREALSYHYERDPGDPRISHALTLEVGSFGNPVRQAQIAYGRRTPNPALAAADQQVQAQSHLTCSDRRYTNAIDQAGQYRTPVLCEDIAQELTGLTLPPGAPRLSFDAVDEASRTATRIAFHQTPTAGVQKRVLDHTRTLFRSDDLAAALPLGVIEPLGLGFETYQLAFAPDHLTALFDDRVTDDMITADGGYVQLGDDSWWIPGGRAFLSPNEGDDAAVERDFARQHFFRPNRFHDGFGAVTTVTYDAHVLASIQTVDPLGNTTSALWDYRVLAPRQVTDINRNRSETAFDILGRVTGTAVMGKPGETLGDTLTGFAPQLTDAERDALLQDPSGPLATSLLAGASSRIVYDTHQFTRTGGPAVSLVITRETHAADLAPGETTAVQVGLSYSDGFGRVVQQKQQAEPGPLTPDGPPLATRWTTSGWTVFNNKGMAVRTFEPFFSADHSFEFGIEVGVSPTLFYDPLGRVVATLHPNKSWNKVILGPWQQTAWDVNDTVLLDPLADPDVGAYMRRLPAADTGPTWHAIRTDPAHAAERAARWPDPWRQQAEADAATKAAAHAGTPTLSHYDALGRPFLTIASDGTAPTETRTHRDIEGQVRTVTDARGIEVMAGQRQSGSGPVTGYDNTGRPLYSAASDSGARWSLPDISGAPIHQWDARGHHFETRYDALRRLTDHFVTGETGGGSPRLFRRLVYGEAQGDAQNHRGRVVQDFDSGGLATVAAYDFKGNALEAQRRMIADYRAEPDWSADPTLAPEIHITPTEYDALNRAVRTTSADGSETLPSYNAAGLLERQSVRLPGDADATEIVSSITYSAFGERARVEYATEDGTGLSTTYDYDPDTLQLSQMRTVRASDGRVLQDLSFAYDPIGNITAIRDAAQAEVFFDNAQVTPDSDYTYDALYRLVRASGREHASQHLAQRDAGETEWVIGIPRPNSAGALHRYIEEYSYDGAGNLMRLAHSGGGALRWSRAYRYADDSNRLLATSAPGDAPGVTSAPYAHDAHGNMTAMPHLPQMRWDMLNRLRRTARTVTDAGTPQTTYYVYAADGRRIRKVTERQAGPGETPTRQSERLYLDASEIYREYAADGVTVTLERRSLHVTDDQGRIAQIDTRTQGSDPSPARTRRLQLSNQIGSVSLELDALGQVISYEEYHPFGTTAYRAGRSAAEAGLKRYRFTGQERDGETGLSYHGARYYAPWLGRWTAADPAGLIDGPNRYRYSRNNPVLYLDEDGMAPSKGDRPKLPGKRAPKLLEWAIDSFIRLNRPFGGSPKKHPKPVDGIEVTVPGDDAVEHIDEVKTEPPPKKPRTFEPPPVDMPPTTQAPHPDPGSTAPDGAGQTARKGTVPHPPEVSVDKRTSAPDAPGSKAMREIGEDVIPDKIDKRFLKRLGRAVGRGAGRFAPGVSVGFSVNDFSEGRYVEGTIGLLGEVPIISPFVDTGVTAYEITSVVEEELGISDYLVPHTQEVKDLPEAYRTKVKKRGAPPFNKPKAKPKPAAKPKPKPPTQRIDIEEPLVVNPDFVGPKRLIDYPIS